MQKIRNELRNLLLKAISLEWNIFFDEMNKLRFSSSGIRKIINDFSDDELKQYRIYQNQQSKLKDIAERSICKCITCGTSDRDMVYNKTYDTWYCTEYYSMHRTYAKKHARQQPQKEPQGHEDKAMDELSKSFL